MGESDPVPIADDEDEVSSARAMRVAAVLARKGGEEFVKPGRLVEVRFVRGQSLSLTASRLLALMILTAGGDAWRSEEHTSELQSLMRISYAVFFLKKKTKKKN